MRALAALALALALAACASAPAPPAPSGGGPPTGRLELGDWRSASARAVAQRFAQAVAQRYAAGAALAAATGDLSGQGFTCEAGVGEGRGRPPAHTCRREIRHGACAHTWQVHLYDENGRLARTRGLYDRTCGEDGLLGG